MGDLPDGFPTMESFPKLQKLLPNIRAYLVSAISYVYTFLCNLAELLYPTVFKCLEIKLDSIYSSLACFPFLQAERTNATIQDMSLFLHFSMSIVAILFGRSYEYSWIWRLILLKKARVIFLCIYSWNISTLEWEVMCNFTFSRVFGFSI